MKSLILGLTILLASFSGSVNEKEKTTVEESVCSEWVEMDMTPIEGCDSSNNFWLCADGKTVDQFLYEAWYFSQKRC